MAHFIYPSQGKTSFLRDGVTTLPTLDNVTPANDRGMPVVLLAGDALGPVDVNTGAAGTKTLRVVLSTDSSISIEEDKDYGVVGANTIRTAAQIGNATGAAEFGTGADSAQTLRVTLSTRAETAATPLSVRLSDGTSFLSVLPVSQSGTWDIQNITGTVSLPTGAATEATSLAISGKLPATLGQKTMADSLAVTLASDQTVIPASQSGTWNINNISGTISLPTGAATESTLSAISGQLPATIGSKVAAQSIAVVQATDSNVPITATALPLPNGAATDVSVQAIVSKLPVSLGQKTMANSLAVVLASDQSSLNINNISGTISLPTGAATESTLSALSSKVANDFGVSTGAVRVASQVGNATGAADFDEGASSGQTLRVVLADESKPQIGLQPVSVISRTYSSSNVTGTYSNLGTALGAAANMVAFFETGGSPLIIGWGGNDKFIVPPGGSESPLPVAIPNGTQLQIKTADASTVSSGNFYMTVLG